MTKRIKIDIDPAQTQAGAQPGPKAVWPTVEDWTARIAQIPFLEEPEFTLWSMFEEALGGEAIESVAISDALFWPDAGDNKEVDSGTLHSVDSAKALLSYDPNDFREPGIHAVYVWTATRVLFVHNYDGKIRINGVPRHPDASEIHSNGEQLS